MRDVLVRDGLAARVAPGRIDVTAGLKVGEGRRQNGGRNALVCRSPMVRQKPINGSIGVSSY